MKDYTITNYPLPEGYELQDFRKEILQKLIDRQNFAFSKTSQVLLVRLDVRLPEDLVTGGSNACFQCFWEKYMRKMKKYVLSFVWVREQNTSRNCHWHVAIFFDRNKLKFFGYPFSANQLWAEAIGKFYCFNAPAAGLIESAPQIRNGLVIHRDNDLLREEALRIVAYIAKKETKGKAAYHAREFGASYTR